MQNNAVCFKFVWRSVYSAWLVVASLILAQGNTLVRDSALSLTLVYNYLVRVIF